MIFSRNKNRRLVKHSNYLLLFLILTGCRTTRNNIPPDAGSYISIFDGKTLDQWKGDTAYWKVEDSCIVGSVTPETILKQNTFLIWQGHMPDDFELTVEYRVSGKGNSGINYRSELVAGSPFALRGYQADLDGDNNYTGSNYEERKRTTLAAIGQVVLLPTVELFPDSLKKHIKNNQWLPGTVTGSLGDRDSLKAFIKKEDWNEYEIMVRGNHLQHYINGVLMSDVTDNDTVNRKFNGLLGVQVHVGPPMQIAYRNFRLRKLN